MATRAAPRPLPTSAFDYALPADRIAQRPASPRDASRLLHLPPHGEPLDHRFRELPALLRPGDLLVVNDTRVRAARLRGRRLDAGGAPAELLVLDRLDGARYACLVRPGRRLVAGCRVRISDQLTADIGEPLAEHPGARAVRLTATGGDVDQVIERVGSAPLPPYIREPLADPARYQTMFAASPPRSAAAPTAGLHFTPRVVADLRRRGVDLAAVRLDVGLATFAPIREQTVDEHVMHPERYVLPAVTAAAVAGCRDRGGRVLAVGTTVARVLETSASGGGMVEAGEGVTRLYLRPGSPPRVIDGMVTNFHQPRSSLLVLLAAVVGDRRWRAAYDHALRSGYRFLSFGDCMLCWTASSTG